jgi:two-component system cell cycle sensor histidine kinase/response regulator CckA
MEGKHCGYRGITRDITERKQLEEERQKTTRLESVGNLAGGIAHDFNNLLTGILGNIQLAQMEVEPDSRAADSLQEAGKASLRARDLTQQLLTFARGGAPVKKVVGVSGLIKESANFSVRGSKSRCECSLPDDLYAIEADGGQLNQVINNLVMNAEQATPEGGIIRVKATNLVLEEGNTFSLPAGKYIHVSVEDHGIGIPEKYQARIFEPYFTTKERGHGLGLATAYSIIKNHDGKMTFESRGGVGTTFHIYLPASNQPVLAETKEVGDRTVVRGKGRILVMDDEGAIRLLLSRILKGAGYEVELTEDGASAIQKFMEARESGKPFDAVILDLTIPGGMGGKGVIVKLREIDPGVKAIVSSGYANDPTMANYKEYGFSGVVNKPYNVKEMVQTLNSIITRAK